MFKKDGIFEPLIPQQLQQQLSVAATTPAVGPSGATDSIPDAATNPVLYISAFTPPPGSNTLVVGDAVTNAIGDFLVNSDSSSIDAETAGGDIISAIGGHTLNTVEFAIVGPSSDAKVNMMLLSSDSNKIGTDRMINVNVKNWDGSIDKVFGLVLGARSAGRDSNGMPRWIFRVKYFGLDREILTVV
jgi:hypothetical protein